MTACGKIFGCPLVALEARAHRANVRKRKSEKLQEFQASALCNQMEQHTLYHWSTALEGHRLDFWPSVGKWRWQEKNYWGSLDSFTHFLRKRGWNG